MYTIDIADLGKNMTHKQHGWCDDRMPSVGRWEKDASKLEEEQLQYMNK
jgi:hypothetical protein